MRTAPKRPESLANMAQAQMFLSLEDELKDARRVHSYGQEEDLRQALQMIINRVVELSSMLKEAYKAQAELETSLNLAKSNLQLLQCNNEMLEEVLKRDSGSTKDVGWRRSGRREIDKSIRRSDDVSGKPDYAYQRAEASPSTIFSPPMSGRSALNFLAAPSPSSVPPTPSTGQDSGFFKFRFTNGSLTRPGTPSTATNGPANLTSPSLPSLPSQLNKELEELTAELQRERTAHQTVIKEKADLEAEIESLSQALFEEANKMVATERIKRAETEEELREARLEKEALRSALRVVEGENTHLRNAQATCTTDDEQPIQNTQTCDAPRSSRSRSSSCVAVKSRHSVESLTSLSNQPSRPLPGSSAPYPPSPPPEPSNTISPSAALPSPEPNSAELTPQDPSRYATATPFMSDEQMAWANIKLRPQALHPDSLFPMPLFSP